MTSYPAVEDTREVYLGGVRYRTVGGVQSVLASVYPAKVVIGDTTRDSQVRRSVMALSDWRSGIGLDKSEEAASVDRAWYSTLNLRHRNNLVLPRLATQTAASAASTVGILHEFGNEVYATYGTSIRKYNNSTDSWGNQIDALPAAATDALVARVNGTVVFFIAHTTGYSYSTDGATFTDDTEDILFLAWWDDKVWGIDSTGQLRWSTWITPGSWTDDAQLPLPNDYVTDLIVGEDAGNNSILYAVTRVGLWAHDFANGQFVSTKLSDLPAHPDFGQGSTRWRDAIFMPARNGVYRYLDGTGTAVVSVVGPDRDDGLPVANRGTIEGLVPSHNELFAVLNGVATASGLDDINLFAGLESPVVPTSTSLGLSSILGWDEQGWQVAWQGALQGEAIGHAIVSNAYDTYRLWWAQGERVWFMDLPIDITNPNQLPEAQYAASGYLLTPWFNIGQDEVFKLATDLDVVMSGVTANETITLSYARNLVDDYTVLRVFDSMPTDGHARIALPSSSNHEGIEWRWIRFKIELARGSNTGLTPHLHSVTMVFRKKLEVTEGFQVQLDLRYEHDGLSPKEQRAALRKLMESQTRLEFTYRPEDPNEDELMRYWVDIVGATNIEETGLNEKGLCQLTLAE